MAVMAKSKHTARGYVVEKNGKFQEYIRAHQCRAKLGLLGGGERCQGAVGHSGNHWAYSPNGDLLTTPNAREEPNAMWASSICPAGHPNYVHPVEMQKHYFLMLGVYRDCKKPKGWDDDGVLSLTKQRDSILKRRVKKLKKAMA